jgi:uncharacterized membrane protein HdeD (DUF308 family)
MQSRSAYIALSVITGLLMVILGGLFIAEPGLSLASIILLLGIFVVVYGVAMLVAGLMGRTESRGWSVAVGVLAIVFGIIVFAWPGATSLAILYIFAAWAIITGIADIGHAFTTGLSGGRKIWLVVIGLLGIVIGVVFFVHPVSGIVALLWLAGIYLIVLGVLRIIAGFTNPPSPSGAAAA